MSKLEFQDKDVICAYGIQDGALYTALRGWLKKDKAHYLIFIEEEEQLFLQAKQGALGRDPQVRLFFYQKESEQEIFHQIAWEFVFLKMHYMHPEKQSSFFESLDHACKAVHLLASDWCDRGEKVLGNLVRNARVFHSSVRGSSLKNSCSKIPAIVCAAGPSLDQALPFLSQLKDRAVILAGGSALCILNERGVIPHYAAYVDPDPSRARFRKQTSFQTPFFYQSRFSSDLLASVHAERIWMASSGNHPLEEWLATRCGMDAGVQESGWTAASFCTFVALHLGCDPIILCGMDFSYSQQEAMYASGLRPEQRETQSLTIKDEEGNTHYSKTDWLLSAAWISACAAEHKERTWINASAGMGIKGIEKKSFQEIDGYLLCSYDIEGHVHSSIAQCKQKINDESAASIGMLKSSFEAALNHCNTLLTLWEASFPKSPLEDAQYALTQVELETEVSYLYFLKPLWNTWKHPILRSEKEPAAGQLHRLLFFKNTLEANIRILC